MNYRTNVKGVTFGNGQQLLAELPLEARLVIEADPSNEHDPNAISVRIAEGPCLRTHLGWIPREMAAQLAKQVGGQTVEVKRWTRTGGGEGFNYGLLIEFDLPDATPKS